MLQIVCYGVLLVFDLLDFKMTCAQVVLLRVV